VRRPLPAVETVVVEIILNYDVRRRRDVRVAVSERTALPVGISNLHVYRSRRVSRSRGNDAGARRHFDASRQHAAEPSGRTGQEACALNRNRRSTCHRARSRTKSSYGWSAGWWWTVQAKLEVIEDDFTRRIGFR